MAKNSITARRNQSDSKSYNIGKVNYQPFNESQEKLKYRKSDLLTALENVNSYSFS